MKNFGLYILNTFLFIFIIFSQQIFAQIEILPGPGVTPEDMVENIVGDGIEYSNVTFQGAAGSRGIFNNGGATNLGIGSGIFLTSGSGYVIPGPNTGSGSGTSNNLGGHPLLTGITSGTTYDASVLEFDFVPESDTLRFRYKFGSDEYNEYVGSQFNDVFGFFVSGPNPDGGMYSNKNVAVLPNTNISVTINNVNNGYANPGIVPTGPCTNCGYFADNTGGLTLEYDAFTTVITATLKVVPCQTYSISIGCADVGDHIFDSGVFIEENSFESPKIEVETDPYPQGVSDNMIEGCVEADIIFRLPHAEYAPITICYEIIEGPGFATNGVDYEEIEDCITFEEGQDSVAIHVVPLNDDLIEGEELIQLVIENTLGCIVRYDTVEFTIVDYVDMVTQTSGNTMICEGMEIDIGVNTINGIPPYTFEWGEDPSLNDTLSVSPDTTTMYHIQVVDMCLDTVTDSLNVMVFPTPDIDLGNDTAVICEGDTLFLEPGGGYNSYTWQDGSTEPTYTVTEPGFYFVTVGGAGGCTSSDSVYVELSYMDISLGADTTICVGDTMILSAGSGFTSYYWQDGSSGATYTVTETGLYWVDVTQDGCSDSDSIYVYVDDPAISVDLGNDIIVCQGEEVVLEPLFGVFISYEWSTGDTTSKITVTEPGTYSLSVVSGCGDAYDEVTVSYFDYPDPNLGPDLQLCEDESVTLWSETMISYNWQDNSTNPFFTVTTSGVYYVDVYDNNGCHGTDTVYAEVGSTVNILEDSMLVCTGETITIDAGYGFDFYTWSNGDYGVQAIDVTEGGKYYSVNVNYFYGCPSSDSVYVSELPKPDAAISGDDEICTGDTLILSAPYGPFSYSWNGGPVTNDPSYLVQQGGNYTLSMSNACGQSYDEVNIQENPLPEPSLGPDVLLFPDESVTLTPGNFTSYLWQDGSNQPNYIVSYEDVNVQDTFWVEVFDGLCKNTDKINVEVFNVEIPTAITPNGDGFNDRFEPITPLTGVNNHYMTVFNRWGQKVWESSDFEDGWDGKNNGRYVDEGTYFWILEVYYGNDDVKKIYKGSLTILGTGS